MAGFTRRAALGALLGAPLLLGRARPAAATITGTRRRRLAVDVALVLATDVSPSVDPDRWMIQRHGCANALRSPAVISALTSGDYGQIAGTLVEWADPGLQRQSVPWAVLDGAETASAFADQIEQAERIHQTKNTSISSGIRFADALLATMPYRATRKVIDVSGDGVENSPLYSPAAVLAATRAAVSHGVTVNGLAVATGEYADLEAYYRDYVIGGTASFALAVSDWSQFGAAIQQKLMIETASARLEPPRWPPAAARIG
jgi:hypothetical protein